MEVFPLPTLVSRSLLFLSFENSTSGRVIPPARRYIAPLLSKFYSPDILNDSTFKPLSSNSGIYASPDQVFEGVLLRCCCFRFLNC